MGRSGRLLALGLVLGGAALWFAAGRGLVFTGAPQPEGHRQPAGVPAPLRPGQPLTLLVVGTSGVARGSWTAELAEALGRCRAAGVSVEKLAKAGANSRWGEPSLGDRLAAGPAVGLVVIEFAGNDSRLVRGMSLAESEARHRRMIEAVRTAGAVPFLATMGRVIGREAVERPGHAAYQDRYRQLARETGVGLIDTRPAWEGTDAELRASLPDGSHFTPEAARALILPGFVAALSPLVCDGHVPGADGAQQTGKKDHQA